MDLFDLLFAVATGTLVWAVVAYQVVRRAVCAGILDADRKRERAAVERRLVKRQMQQAGPPADD